MARDNFNMDEKDTRRPPDDDGPTGDDDVTVEGDISLESILAEYKGSAYIAGDKKTPSGVLKQKADKIVQEAAGGKYRQAAPETAARGKAAQPLDKTVPLPTLSDLKDAAAGKTHETKPEPRDDELNSGTKNVIPITRVSAADDETDEDVAEAIARQTALENETRKTARKVFGLFGRNTYADDDEEEIVDDAALEGEPVPEEIFEEPDFRSAVKRFAHICNSYSLRSLASLAISVLMAVLTLMYEAGAALPFGIGRSLVLTNGILMMLMFCVMLLALDTLIRGVMTLVKGEPGAETLNVFSCLVTAAAATFAILTHNESYGVPYCVVSALSLTFTLWGEKTYARAMTETLKTAQAASEPVGIIAEICDDLGRTIIKKVSDRTAGFYNNLIQEDFTAMAYRYAAPLLLVMAAVFSLYASFGHGQGPYFLHHFAAIMAAAAPFSSVLAFAVPFNAIARRARQSGAAIAGWGGADDLYHTDGVGITDEDLFPTGTLSLGGIKIFEEVQPDKAIRYTGSLIIASESGLSKLFADHLSKQGMNQYRVEDFTCYEGGIGGLIRGERVYTGSGAFMNLMGVRVPSSLNMKNAVFTAINKKLIAVFAVNYVPVKSVQNALVSVLRHHVKLFFAVRDFNITPIMLEQKFKVSIHDVEYMPIQKSYDISDDSLHEAKRITAIVSREGMGPYVESITGGRRLRTTAIVSTIFSVASALFGMLIMFVVNWSGSLAAASAGNLIFYMMSMLFAVLVICGFARYGH
ncbi:hypothetical protein AAFA46_03885 [Oscillospiraceae bacterium WX1]